MKLKLELNVSPVMPPKNVEKLRKNVKKNQKKIGEKKCRKQF